MNNAEVHTGHGWDGENETFDIEINGYYIHVDKRIFKEVNKAMGLRSTSEQDDIYGMTVGVLRRMLIGVPPDYSVYVPSWYEEENELANHVIVSDDNRAVSIIP